jgi:hypothetical protein
MWKEVGGLDLVQRELHFFGSLWSLWLSFGGDDFSSLFSLALLKIVLSNSLEESKSGVRVSDVLDSNVDLLSDLSLLDLFFDNDSDRSWVDIEDLSSSTMVKVVGHTFMNGTVNNDVDIVSESVLFEVVAHSDSSVSSESFGKLMSGS